VTSAAAPDPRWSSHSGDVVILRWPEQADRIEHLDRLRVPRLLLVEPGVQPPSSESCIQDWLRLPADDADVRARVRALERRAANHPARISIEDSGQLTYRDRTVYLSPLEQRIAQVLIDRFRTIVDDQELINQVWPNGASSVALRVHLSRLRNHLAPLGLAITGVRNQGHVMHETTDVPAPRTST